ncbi:hypothetical protein PLCT2_01274 [Planctomycetaceae bacterium]|nr:hypothetical protein PLCT2_01274 [Planctomycetaceae bacterium]
MNQYPVLIGLLMVLALFSLTLMIFRLFGFDRSSALYLACLSTALILYWLTRRVLKGR